MTPEEAIEIMWKAESLIPYGGSSERGGLAFDMAREALRRQEALPGLRAKFKEALDKAKKNAEETDDYFHYGEVRALEEALEMIDDVLKDALS